MGEGFPRGLLRASGETADLEGWRWSASRKMGPRTGESLAGP